MQEFFKKMVTRLAPILGAGASRIKVMTPMFHSRNFVIIALSSFVAVAIFCLWTATAMSIDNTMNDCAPYGSEAVLCSTNAQNHISAWQNFLNVVPQKTFDSLLPILLLAFASLVHWNNLVRSRAPNVGRRIKTRSYETIDIVDPIRRALSRGIIQPQIYNSLIG